METDYENPRPADDDGWKDDKERAAEEVVHVESDADLPKPSAWSRQYLQLLRDFESRSPLNAAIVEAMKATVGKNASRIARLVKEKGFDTSHDTVYRRILAFINAANAVKKTDKRWRDRRAGSADIYGSGRTKAAHQAVISVKVPAFVQRDFHREGPITLAEWKAWSDQMERPPVRPGLAQDVIVEDLPEDPGPYYIVVGDVTPSRKAR